MLDTSKIQLDIQSPEVMDARHEASVMIKIAKDLPAHEILGYMRSGSFKADIAKRWANKHAPGYGINFIGGPEPVFKKDRDRSSGVTGYRQHLGLVRWD